MRAKSADPVPGHTGRPGQPWPQLTGHPRAVNTRPAVHGVSVEVPQSQGARDTQDGRTEDATPILTRWETQAHPLIPRFNPGGKTPPLDSFTHPSLHCTNVSGARLLTCGCLHAGHRPAAPPPRTQPLGGQGPGQEEDGVEGQQEPATQEKRSRHLSGRRADTPQSDQRLRPGGPELVGVSSPQGPSSPPAGSPRGAQRLSRCTRQLPSRWQCRVVQKGAPASRLPGDASCPVSHRGCSHLSRKRQAGQMWRFCQTPQAILTGALGRVPGAA